MMRTQTKMGSCLLARFLFYSTSFVVLSSELSGVAQTTGGAETAVIAKADWTAIGAAVAVIIAAIGAVWVKLRSLNHNLNSKLDLLIKSIKKIAYDKGVADERERATEEKDDNTR